MAASATTAIRRYARPGAVGARSPPGAGNNLSCLSESLVPLRCADTGWSVVGSVREPLSQAAVSCLCSVRVAWRAAPSKSDPLEAGHCTLTMTPPPVVAARAPTARAADARDEQRQARHKGRTWLSSRGQSAPASRPQLPLPFQLAPVAGRPRRSPRCTTLWGSAVVPDRFSERVVRVSRVPATQRSGGSRSSSPARSGGAGTRDTEAVRPVGDRLSSCRFWMCSAGQALRSPSLSRPSRASGRRPRCCFHRFSSMTFIGWTSTTAPPSFTDLPAG